MSFVQSAFIRQNDAELREAVTKIGYKISGVFGDSLATAASISTVRAIAHEWFYSSDPHTTWSHNRINCGVDREMFLAIIALSHTTDKFQWFVSEDGDWYFCNDNKFNEDLANWLYSTSKKSWHKATISELIQKFKPKKFSNND